MKIIRSFFGFFLILTIILLSCNGQENSDSHSIYNEDDTSFTADTIKESNANIDTMTFMGSNDNYDYWYAFFKSNAGLEKFVYGFSVELKEELVGSDLKIEWEMDTLYEAGEGDEPYEQKRILSFEIVNKAPTFFDFMHEFARIYTDTARNIDQFKSNKIPYEKAWNPGAACFLGGNPPDFVQVMRTTDYEISSALPLGSFCDGYEDAADGFYFVNRRPDMPVYADLNDAGDFIEMTAELPDVYKNNAVRKVLVIEGGWQFAELYFVWIDGEWKLWIEDFCDCSA